ncbi:MAG: hypothetical protein QXT53_08250 [Ignisphaera sp.]
MPKTLIDVLDLLDSFPYYSQEFKARIQYMDLTFLVGRYYIAVHGVLFPIVIDSDELPAQRVFLEPIATIYIQESKAIVYIRQNSKLDVFREHELGKAPVINLSEDEKLLVLAASAIADKIVENPSEKNILRVLPSNLRTYVEAAMDAMRAGPSIEAVKASPKTGLESLGRKFLEYVLWLGKANYDIVKEVDYVFGVTMRTLRVRYQSFDVEIKAFSRAGVAESLGVVEKILPINIVSSIIRNIEKSFKVLYVASSLL